MRDPVEELVAVAQRMEGLIARAAKPEVSAPIERLHEAAERVGKAWSGSDIGYHATVYYSGLEPPPPGAHFSQEWGLFGDEFVGGSTGDWQKFDPDEVVGAIRDLAGKPDEAPAYALRDEIYKQFEDDRMDVVSILESHGAEDKFLEGLKVKLSGLSVEGVGGILKALLPNGKVLTRDRIAAGQGFPIPPHLSVVAKVLTVEEALDKAAELASLSRHAGRHMERNQRSSQSGDRVFVGHGQSASWRELKDFLQDRLGLGVDEFNRVPVAGKAHKERLSEMLDAAAMAFVVMTGEDEQPDGSVQPRMNAVHELGLFQGRLGFDRAIVLLEEGCTEFSNIAGLNQLRFPKGRIDAVFEQVRQVLERENLLADAS